MNPIALCEMLRKIFLVNNKKLFVLDTYMKNVMQMKY